MQRITVIGSLNMDFAVSVPKHPAPGETILASDMELIPGGKGANQAYTLARLGAQATMLGAVGSDSYGYLLEESLQSAGVDTQYLLHCQDTPTGLALISVDPSGNNSITVIPGANTKVDTAYLDRCLPVIEQSDIVIFQLEIPLETVTYGAKLAKQCGCMVILDPAPAPRQPLTELYPFVDLIKPNETELAALTHTAPNLPPEKAAGFLIEQGVRQAVVTLGEKGALLCCCDKPSLSIPAVPALAVDTTAAGDAFTAALALGLSKDASLEEAAVFASHVSSLVVSKKGAQKSIPTLGEVKQAFPHLQL